MVKTENPGFRIGPLAVIKSMAASFPYWCMSAMRILTPYLFAIVFVLLQVPHVYAAATSTEAFVQQNIDRGLAVLNDSRLAPQQRDQQFRDLLLSVTDVKRVAVFTLGQYARGASDDQVNGFMKAFGDYFTAVFQTSLNRNSGETVEVTGSKIRAADDVIVNGKLSGGDSTKATPVNIAFRVRKNPAGADVVVDLQVEGISMALTERDEFGSYLQRHGGNIALLSAELETRARRLRTGDSLAQSRNPKGAAGSNPGE